MAEPWRDGEGDRPPRRTPFVFLWDERLTSQAARVNIKTKAFLHSSTFAPARRRSNPIQRMVRHSLHYHPQPHLNLPFHPPTTITKCRTWTPRRPASSSRTSTMPAPTRPRLSGPTLASNRCGCHRPRPTVPPPPRGGRTGRRQEWQRGLVVLVGPRGRTCPTMYVHRSCSIRGICAIGWIHDRYIVCH